MEPRAAVTGWRSVPEAPMQLGKDHQYPNVGTLAAVIAHSQIVVGAPGRTAPRLPAGFDDVDLAVLDWIAAEGRRLGRSLWPL
jgi:hypothetical protein